MSSWFMAHTFILDEIIYILCGLIAIITGIKALKNEKSPIGTFVFWTLAGLLFIFGGFLVKYLKSTGEFIIGIGVCVLAVLTFTKKVTMGTFKTITEEEKRNNNKSIGAKIFIPALVLAFTALLFSQVGSFKIPAGFNDKGKEIVLSLSTAQALGYSSIIALIVTILITKGKRDHIKEDTTRLLMQVGTSSLLPQLLAALGAVFTAAGVGTVIASIVTSALGGSTTRLVGVIVYCIGMVLFTMIMGNAYAAFTVITVGVGIPFIIELGGNPAIVGALGMTAGFCGTLLTPMAANFNIVPANILEANNQYTVIKTQLFVAIPLIIVHIILMYLLAF